MKWLPHCQHPEARDGCGERRLVFSSPADLESFAGDELLDRKEWTPPASGLHGGPDPSAPPLWVIVDDNCGAAEDWAGATGKRGVGRVCFVRLAPEVGVGAGAGDIHRASASIPTPRTGCPTVCCASGWGWATGDVAARRTRRRLLRRRRHHEHRRGRAVRAHPGSVAARRRGHRRRPPTVRRRDLLEVLGIRDARKLDVDRLWSARRTQNRLWMRFPIGLDPTGEVVELDLKETSQYGMGMHSVLIGFSGSGKSETIITEVTSLALTHSPETVNVAFLDWKMKSAGIVLERFPHVVASVSNLGDEMHLVERMLEALEGELDRRGALCAATNCKDLNVYNEKRMVDPSLEPVPGLVVIIDEYQELFRSELGTEFVDLCWRIVRQGRSMHVFLQLAGQTVDSHRLMKIRSLIGFFMALRTGTEEDSREAIGSSIAAHLPEKGKEGTGYLREGMRPPREFRAFYSSPPFVPPPEDGGPAPVAAAGTWFTPRSFTATEVPDEDGSARTAGDERSRARAGAGAGPGAVGARRAAADRGRHDRGLVARDRRPPAPPALAAPAGEAGDRRRAGPAGAGQAVGCRLRQESRPGVPRRHRGPPPTAPAGCALAGSAGRQRFGDRRAAVRCDDHAGDDDDDGGADVPAGAGAVLLRGRRRSEPRRGRWTAPCRGPRSRGGPRGRRPHHCVGAGHRRRARGGVRQDRTRHGGGPAAQVQRQARTGAGRRRRRRPRHRRLGDIRHRVSPVRRSHRRVGAQPELRRARGRLAHQLPAGLQAGAQAAGHRTHRAAADRPGRFRDESPARQEGAARVRLAAG